MNNADIPAWPTEIYGDSGEFIGNHVGLTKRELFAMAAMQGLLSGNEFSCAEQTQANQVAAYAVQQADALLKELSKEPQA